VNGDGYGDLIVGAWGNDTGGADAGRAYVYYGGPGADAVADVILTGQAAGDRFGVSVSSAGDVNGDLYGDVVVGANGFSAYRGRAYVYYGGRTADTVADLTLVGEAPGDNFGYSVARAGDLNGDGYGDVIVGASGHSGGKGRAYVYYGGPGVDAAVDLVLSGGAPSGLFGWSVASAGDVNGDGWGDIIVGAWEDDSPGADAGRAYVYFGGAGMDALADLTLDGAAGDHFGISVSTAGDPNGDGFADVVVGARNYGTNTGRTFLYDFNRYHVTAPTGGETWNVGAMETISWAGAEPAVVWLSVDGGRRYEVLESGVGGSPTNSLPLQVPHAPTKFAKIRLTAADPGVAGGDESDSLFTIQTSVALLSLLASPLPERGATISWKTNPGPEDLAGYRLDRAALQTGAWRTLVSLTRETSYADPEGGPGSHYRLFAVNGLGEVLWLGETLIRPRTPIAAWPVPYRSGDLTVSFATYSGLGGGAGPAEVSLYDVRGRLVRTIARGDYAAGYHTAIWDGRDQRGRRVAAGVYFLKARCAGQERTLKLAVLR